MKILLIILGDKRLEEEILEETMSTHGGSGSSSHNGDKYEERFSKKMTLRQYSIPPVYGMSLSINLPPICVDSFEFHFNLIQTVQQSKFGGGANEDSNKHLISSCTFVGFSSKMGCVTSGPLP